MINMINSSRYSRNILYDTLELQQQYQYQYKTAAPVMKISGTFHFDGNFQCSCVLWRIFQRFSSKVEEMPVRTSAITSTSNSKSSSRYELDFACTYERDGHQKGHAAAWHYVPTTNNCCYGACRAMDT